MCALSQLSILAGLLVGYLPRPAEDVVGPSGVTFKLKQKDLAPGPKASPDGKVNVAVNALSVQLLDAVTNKPLGPSLVHRALRKDSRITAWAFSPDGKRLAVGTGDPRGKAMGDSVGEVRIWDVATGQLLDSIHPARGNIGYVHAVAFSPDGKAVLVDCLELSGH